SRSIWRFPMMQLGVTLGGMRTVAAATKRIRDLLRGMLWGPLLGGRDKRSTTSIFRSFAAQESIQDSWPYVPPAPMVGDLDELALAGLVAGALEHIGGASERRHTRICGEDAHPPF